MAEHTPTPWTVDEVPTSCGRCFRIGSKAQLAEQRDKRGDRKLPSYACLYDDYGQGANATKANADFIVRAVNSHAILMTALAEFLNVMHARGEFDEGCFYFEGKYSSELQTAIRLGDAALLAAREVKP